MATKRMPTTLLPLLLRPSFHQPPTRLFNRIPLTPPRPVRLTLPLHRSQSTLTPPPKSYTFDEVRTLTTSPPPSRLIIDVREPSELASTGRIPGAVSMPITSNPDAIYLSPDDFRDRFGFEKPGASSSEVDEEDEDEDVDIGGEGGAADISPSVTAQAGHGGADPSADLGEGRYGGGGGGGDEGGGVQEVVFYCKAGVRSRTAARMAVGDGGWRGVKVGEMGGGWLEWEGKGGEVER